MKKIAIIGGSYLQLPAVLKAKELSLEVHCFSWPNGAICAEYADFFYPISIVEKEEILNICKKVNIDAIITIASDLAVITVNYVANKLGLISNMDSYTNITTNKYLMRECFKENMIPSPCYKLIKSGENFIPENLKFPLIVKPTDRSGSKGVEKVWDMNVFSEAVERAKSESFSHEVIVEEFVEGREVSVESISFQGVHYILQITDKVTTGEPYFVELEHHQPSTLSSEIQSRVKNIVLNALTALHIHYGASHTELKITVNGDIKVIEVGARMGGDFIGSNLVELSTGYDFLKGVIQVAMGDFEIPAILEHSFSGVYFLSNETKRLLSIFENRKLYPEIIDMQITDKNIRNIECSGDRSGYLIYKSNKRLII